MVWALSHFRPYILGSNDITVVKVRGGSFADPTSAEKAAANLKKTGLTAKVVKAGK